MFFYLINNFTYIQTLFFTYTLLKYIGDIYKIKQYSFEWVNIYNDNEMIKDLIT